MVRKEKERRQCKHHRHGLGKDVVLCSAPGKGNKEWAGSSDSIVFYFSVNLEKQLREA